MIKQASLKLEDTNVAGIGSDLDKKVREAAARTEKAWTNAGKAPGTEVWRIEQFNVKSWPKEEYGKFFSGDSYIVLNTYKTPGSDALKWNVHFWLGLTTTQDEAGTAAYKTVELDDLLGGAPVQYREVQGYESAQFLKLFHNEIHLLDGGAETGFKHVEAAKYAPRLLHIKGKKTVVRVTQVDLKTSSLNSGDVFILDKGAEVFQWNGKNSGGSERVRAAQTCRAIVAERKGKAKLTVLSEEETEPEFWDTLSGFGPVKSADEGGTDEHVADLRKAFRLSDASGSLSFEQVAEGKLTRSIIKSEDVYIVDSGAEVTAWVGKGASPEEKRSALQYAQDYLVKFNRPIYTPIVRVLEGGENESFWAVFS